METIYEEDKSNLISKHNLAIPPEVAITHENSLYISNSPQNTISNPSQNTEGKF